MEGPSWNLDEEAEVWTRNGPIKVILKRLDNSQNINQEFVNQLYRYYKCLQSGSLADYFGMTKDPTSCYMFVMRYYENGNLYSYLDESMGVLCWRDIVDMLWAISAGLNFIHERDLIHGNLHGGNILVENEMDSIDTKIADTGIHGHVDKQTSYKQIYGVIPFVAPEIFNGPTASQLYECLGNWVTAICDDPDPSELSNQFDIAEEIKFSNLEQLHFNILPCHEKAIYYSRPLNFSEPFLYGKM
ncbi:unnamed protein product [Rhizophagus irregularis]|nr:unnamed protein product [Rhizophagus irregularis]